MALPLNCPFGNAVVVLGSPREPYCALGLPLNYDQHRIMGISKIARFTSNYL